MRRPAGSSVEGSACVAVRCASNESFGFDTLRPKENNLRIRIDDTSTSASFLNNGPTLRLEQDGASGFQSQPRCIAGKVRHSPADLFAY